MCGFRVSDLGFSGAALFVDSVQFKKGTESVGLHGSGRLAKSVRAFRAWAWS